LASTLSPLQREVLEAFFRRESGFYLTGGAALAGFHLGHRTTEDLDLFTATDRLVEGEAALSSAAAEIGARLERLITAPDFRRWLATRADEGVVVDLVLDRAGGGSPETLRFGNVRVDSPAEILANKLCTLLSRAEPRDLVDVWALERTGLRVEDALPRAREKDGGLTPAQLAWVLSEVRIGDDAPVPGGGSVVELRRYLSDLCRRLTRAAFPVEEAR
jgi:hypothetical protein